MATTPDLTALTDEQLSELFREAEREHAAIRAAEPSPSAIIDPDDPAVLTDEMREAAAAPWSRMQAVALERDRRRHTPGETNP